MRKKLRDDRGETLIEVLASILICTLSISLLLGAIMTSSDIDSRTQALDEQYYQDLTRAERQSDGTIATDPGDAYGDVPGAVTVKVKAKSEGTEVAERDFTQLPVDTGKLKFYGTDRLLSYRFSFSEATGP